MTRPASMRDAMPLTADWVDKKRAEWGRDHVNDCVRRAMAGEPGYFYAIEGGHVLGTPWPVGAAVEGSPLPPGQVKGRSVVEWQRAAVLCGAAFAGFMREPGQGGERGAD